MVIGRDRLTKGGGQRGRGETRRCARGAAGEQEAVRGGGGPPPTITAPPSDPAIWMPL